MIRSTRRTAPAEPTPAPTLAEVWPEGVIARYLTAAGAALADPTITVDVTGSGDRTYHQCTGCGDDGRAVSWPEWRSRELAQAHAETCLALPRPTSR